MIEIHVIIVHQQTVHSKIRLLLTSFDNFLIFDTFFFLSDINSQFSRQLRDVHSNKEQNIVYDIYNMGVQVLLTLKAKRKPKELNLQTG